MLILWDGSSPLQNLTHHVIWFWKVLRTVVNYELEREGTKPMSQLVELHKKLS